MLIDMKRFAIYTAIVGNYDGIQQPIITDDRFDYILFSNDAKETSVGVWQVRPINYDNDDKIKIARWVKTHPEQLLEAYEFSVWMDANIQIKTDYIYKRTVELFDKKDLISTVIHPIRNCIYKEMFVVYDLGLETENTLLNWAKVLHRNEYPHNNGLHETNIMYRIHSQSVVEKLDGFWWRCIDKYSRRDQLSFNYVLWKLNINCCSMLPNGQSAFNSDDFNYISHTNSKRKFFDRNTDFSLLRRYYLDLPEKKSEIENVYYKIFNLRFPKFWAWVYGLYYRIKFHVERRCTR